MGSVIGTTTCTYGLQQPPVQPNPTATMSWIYVSNSQGRNYLYLSSTCLTTTCFSPQTVIWFSYKYLCKGLKKLVIIVIVLLWNRSFRLCNFWAFCVPVFIMNHMFYENLKEFSWSWLSKRSLISCRGSLHWRRFHFILFSSSC